MRTLARRLIAASQTVSDEHVTDAVLVTERLRIPVARFAGADGFASLLRRALALARVEMPVLRDAKIGADGKLQGFESLAREPGANGATSADEAAVAVLAHLLELLVTFIGEPFTLRLVREAWPDLSVDEDQSRIEAES